MLELPVRATTLLTGLLDLPGVVAVDPGSWQLKPGQDEVVVRMRLTRRRLVCPQCSYTTAHCYDTWEVDSSWWHLDLGGRVCQIWLRR
jgi:transposase